MLPIVKMIAAATSVLGFSVSAHAASQAFDFSGSAFDSNLDGSQGSYAGPVTIRLTYDPTQLPYRTTSFGSDYAVEYYRGSPQPISFYVDGPLGAMTGAASYTRTHYFNNPDPRDPFTAFDQYIFNGTFARKSNGDSLSNTYSFFFLLNTGIAPVGSPTILNASPIYSYEFAVANLSRDDATYEGFQGSFDASDVSPVTPAVPEPRTWGMMILGMGAIGFAMRRRRKNNTCGGFA